MMEPASLCDGLHCHTSRSEFDICSSFSVLPRELARPAMWFASACQRKLEASRLCYACLMGCHCDTPSFSGH
jgi:hypothetical protein